MLRTFAWSVSRCQRPRARTVALALLGCCSVSCERPAARVATRESAAAAPPDTVVRRVVRVYRRASAMQRITPALHALRALQPLDTALAIRVLDQRGLELGGVSVRWTVAAAGPGAELRIVNATTDKDGVSRARFTPGASASVQSVLADVPNVGRIPFDVTVPTTAILLAPSTRTIWSDETALLGAELRDHDGHQLSGGALAWGSSDTSVLRVASVDSLHARVSAVLAGDASVIAWMSGGSGTPRGSAAFRVQPVVAGAFVTPDGEAVPALHLEIEAGSRRDSIPVQQGRFNARIGIATETVDVRAQAVGSTRFHPVALRVYAPRQLQNLWIALVPTLWRIDSGSYVGREIAVDALRAMRRTADGAPFWRLVPASGTGPRKLLGWRSGDFPLRIAFDHAKSREVVTAEDSVAFWAAARQMEQDLGMTLFTPAEMSADPTRDGIIPVEIGVQFSEGHTFVSWGQSGDVNQGIVLFRHTATMRDSRVVTHELLHLLGFGHTTGWPTVAQAVGGREARLTPEDVAYVQLAMRLAQLQARTGARPGLPIATQ